MSRKTVGVNILRPRYNSPKQRVRNKGTVLGVENCPFVIGWFWLIVYFYSAEGYVGDVGGVDEVHVVTYCDDICASL